MKFKWCRYKYDRCICVCVRKHLPVQCMASVHLKQKNLHSFCIKWQKEHKHYLWIHRMIVRSFVIEWNWDNQCGIVLRFGFLFPIQIANWHTHKLTFTTNWSIKPQWPLFWKCAICRMLYGYNCFCCYIIALVGHRLWFTAILLSLTLSIFMDWKCRDDFTVPLNDCNEIKFIPTHSTQIIIIIIIVTTWDLTQNPQTTISASQFHI